MLAPLKAKKMQYNLIWTFNPGKSCCGSNLFLKLTKLEYAPFKTQGKFTIWKLVWNSYPYSGESANDRGHIERQFHEHQALYSFSVFPSPGTMQFVSSIRLNLLLLNRISFSITFNVPFVIISNLFHQLQFCSSFAFRIPDFPMSLFTFNPSFQHTPV